MFSKFVQYLTFFCLQRKLALQLQCKHIKILKKKKHKHSSNRVACLKEIKKRKEQKKNTNRLLKNKNFRHR